MSVRPFVNLSSTFRRLRQKNAGLLLAVVLALAANTTPALAQTFTIIHYFTGGADGGAPAAGLTKDAAGNFYGTTNYGGNLGGSCGTYGCGTVFLLKHSGSGWVLTPIYSFTGGNDGLGPNGRVTIARDGTLYGSTYSGGGNGCGGQGCGTVFHLTPAPAATRSAPAPWKETVIHRFAGTDGQAPQGDLIFDQSGTIFGTTIFGGPDGSGVIYELTPSGGSWTETILYSPQDASKGINPYGGVLFDMSGNLYGVFRTGGSPYSGTVYELTPSGQGWTEQTLHNFDINDGAYPEGGLIQDASGNIYGTTSYAGSGSGGTAFELTPANGGWTFNLLYGFSSSVSGPEDKLVMDGTGNLYGTTYLGGLGYGAAFKLTPSNGSWMYTSLHNFVGTDGAYVISNLVFDSSGNLYGTTYGGGTGNCGFSACGVVFEITP